MYQDSKRTCTAIVLLIKPFVWRRSCRRRGRELLKLPITAKTRLHSLCLWFKVPCCSLAPQENRY